MYDDFFSRHERVILCFSPGKDSAACLSVMRDYLPRIEVVWVNPGNACEETIAYMQEVERQVPRFTALKGKQPEFFALYGPPALGEVTCCMMNRWRPLNQYIIQEKITGIIRGQKASDLHKPNVKSGDVIEGIEFLHPLETWTDEDVIGYLGDSIPASYKRGLKTSLDCYGCTAYGR